ncbi:MAG: hypothetical protein NTX25_08685 [Proteobacteria bacterium]|nr:hypothetical protein [Pseudomonadota bacterium]
MTKEQYPGKTSKLYFCSGGLKARRVTRRNGLDEAGSQNMPLHRTDPAAKGLQASASFGSSLNRALKNKKDRTHKLSLAEAMSH